MSVFTRRKARHAPAAVRAARSAAELAEPQGRHSAQDEPSAAPEAPVNCSLDYDDPGWGDDEPHEATSPGFPLQAPSGDDTIVFRAPDPPGVPGYAISPGTPRMTHPDGALPHRTPGAAVPAGSVPVLRTEPADPGLLRNLRDALLALPAEPERRPQAPPPPAAWVRAVQPDGSSHLDARLDGRARFTRVVPGTARLAEVELGTVGRGPFRVAASRDWLRATAMVLAQAADALPEGETPGSPVNSRTPA